MTKDFVGGTVATLLGISFALYAYVNLDLGMFRRMGPGMFPMMVGVALASLGAIQMLGSLRSKDRADVPSSASFRFKSITWLVAAVLGFGLSVRPLGLILAIFVTVFLAIRADRSTRTRDALIIAVSLSVVSVLIFGVALGLPIRMLPIDL